MLPSLALRSRAQPAMTGFEQMLEFRFDRNMPQAYSFGPTVGRHMTKKAFWGKRQMTGEFTNAPFMVAGAVPTVGELFRSCAQVHSASTAIEYQGRQITYGQLLDRVQRATAMLAAQGLRRGDLIALLSHNRPEYFELELAAAN